MLFKKIRPQVRFYLVGAFLSAFIMTSKSAGPQQKPKTERTTMRIGMVSIYVDSPVKAFKFYTEILGFIKVMYESEAGLAIVASPQDPEGTVLLLEPNEKPLAKNYQQELYRAGIPGIVFFTENILEEFIRLKNRGVKFKKEPTATQWGIEAIFDDTCGNWIQLHQLPKK